MLRRVAFLLALTVVAWAGLPPGRPLPDVPISQLSGKSLDLKQYRGKALVLAVIATTCTDCGAVVDLLKQIQDEQRAWIAGGGGRRRRVRLGACSCDDAGKLCQGAQAEFPAGLFE